MPLPAIVPALGPAVLAGIGSMFGQRSANQANVRLSREGMAFEAEQVAKQMAFQERMSGSSYQRAVEDMRLAGINPMLAYAQGGASTPGGGAASGAAATVQDAIGPAVSSAMGAKRLGQELRVMKEQQWNLEADRALKRAQTLAARAQGEKTDVERNLLELERPAAQRSADLYSGKGGAVFGVIDRLFGGRALSPIGLRR